MGASCERYGSYPPLNYPAVDGLDGSYTTGMEGSPYLLSHLEVSKK